MKAFKKYAFLFLFIAVIPGFGLLAFGQGAPSPAPFPSPADAAALVPAFQTPSAAFPDFLTSHAGTVTTTLMVALEFVAHLWPSAKPMGWLYAISGLFKWLAKVSEALAGVLDVVVAQKTHPPAPPAA